MEKNRDAISGMHALRPERAPSSCPGMPGRPVRLKSVAICVGSGVGQPAVHLLGQRRKVGWQSEGRKDRATDCSGIVRPGLLKDSRVSLLCCSSPRGRLAGPAWPSQDLGRWMDGNKRGDLFWSNCAAVIADRVLVLRARRRSRKLTVEIHLVGCASKCLWW
ncbi:hypothetical protein MRX96_007786 [Rhipicephalus microplus]